MKNRLENQLIALDGLLSQLTDMQFASPVPLLSDASIGSHTRHIIEIGNCLKLAKKTGTVDYFNRSRDLNLERDKELCRQAIASFLENFSIKDMPLQMYVFETGLVSTTYQRELAYITNHTIHHMALIKVALIYWGCADLVDSDFGVEASTLKYRETLSTNIK
jgi:hypothetical protein